MKNVKLIALVLVTISLLAVPLAWAQGGNPPASTKESGQTSGHDMTAAEQSGKGVGAGSVEQTVLKLEDEFADALKKGDCAFLEKNFSDDCINIFANGQLATKAELVNACNSGQMKYDTFDLKKDDRKVRVYGNTAVLTSKAEVKGHQGSTVVSGTYRRTLVFVKMKNDQWQLVTAQATKEQ
jgi:ketosteroid isomerase-like protein